MKFKYHFLSDVSSTGIISSKTILLIPECDTNFLASEHNCNNPIDSNSERQEKLFSLDLDLLETDSCLSTFAVQPRTDALIEIPIKKTIRKPKIYETTQEMLIKDDENPFEYMKFGGRSENITTHEYDLIDFSAKEQNFDSNEISGFSADAHCTILRDPKELETLKIDLGNISSGNIPTASNESLNDQIVENNDTSIPETFIDDDYEPIDDNVDTSWKDVRNRNDIWWEGTYRNLSIVPEEDEENMSLLGSSCSRRTYGLNPYTQLSSSNPQLAITTHGDTFICGRSSSESSVGSSTSFEDDTYDLCRKNVKAEVKLLVKTIDEGKEAIEIRSVRDFMDPKTTKKQFSSSPSQENKDPTFYSKFSQKLNSLSNKFGNLSEKVSLIPKREQSNGKMEFEEQQRQPSFILPQIFVRSSNDPALSNLQNTKELSRSKIELLAATRQEYPLDLQQNIDTGHKSYDDFRLHGNNTSKIPSKSIEGTSEFRPYCDWLCNTGDFEEGKCI